MQLSTNLPTTLAQYDALPGEDGHKLAPNVSPETDAAFMPELRRENPEPAHHLRRKFERAVGSVR